MEKNYMNAVAKEVVTKAVPQKIEQKIVSWKVQTTEDEKGNTHTVSEPVTLERPRVVTGRTYKISPAVTDSAMYITINDVTLDDGTRRPVEMFIHTKHVAHQQWITALTRMVSAIFRKPGPYLFVADELQQIYDPQGGYFAESKMMPSVVAHVAQILREHFVWIGAMDVPVLTDLQVSVMTQKKEQAAKAGVKMLVCDKCHESAVVMLDNCFTCTSCADSKCG
jgi:hypothetical protein